MSRAGSALTSPGGYARQRRIIYNHDAGASASCTTAEEFVAARLQQLVDTQVDTVTLDACAMDGLAHYPSRVMDVMVDNPLVAAGHDPIALALNFCRANHLEFFASCRMNDVHDSMPLENYRARRPYFSGEMSTWKQAHPKCLMGEPADRELHPITSPRHWWSAKDYAKREVRERQVLVVEEICTDYELDGVELDWLRAPIYFRPSLDFEPVEPNHVALMNDLVRRIRHVTSRIADKRGRPLLVSCRVPLTLERSRAIGLDVEAWLQEGLVDLLSIGGGYAPMAMAPQVREMANVTHYHGVPVYPCISGSGMTATHATVEAWRGAAMNILAAGADGVYTFNFFPTGPDERLRQIGSLSTLRRLNKLYAVDCVVADQFHGQTRLGLVAPGRLPVALQSGQPARVELPVGEDIVADALPGLPARAVLRLQVSGVSARPPAVPITVLLNGTDIGTGSKLEAESPLSTQADTCWVEIQLDPHLVKRGTNLIELAVSGGAQDEHYLLKNVDLAIEYD